ncbi:MAG: HAMP domain-containing histidine kinase [Lachnospiraceae bacterium]|nr:HAMP domain-containing histidine kinase [Lachnospiraceae bacterium]
MNYLRNGEVKKEIFIFAILWCGGCALGGVAGASSGAAAVALVGGLFCLLHFYFSYRRYREIAALSEKISRFLHGYESLSIEAQKEGELSVLENEVQKMILRLKNQADLLKNEKIHLVNSIADISHQIRTPLTSVNLIVSRLSSPDLSVEKRRELLMELEGMLVHIDWLIQSLLKISKLDAGTIVMLREKVMVRELIRLSIEALEIPMELKNQTLEVSCGTEVSFAGDLKWMKEALSNIIKNCMEHTPEGGRIWIEATENPMFTEIIVRDNGPGIAKEELPHLFERFFKGKNSSEKSVGIGLALARMIIRGQEGNVSAENAPEGGAKFVIRFYKTAV